MNYLTDAEIELNEGLFIVEMEDRFEIVEFSSAASNSICRDANTHPQWITPEQ